MLEWLDKGLVKMVLEFAASGGFSLGVSGLLGKWKWFVGLPGGTKTWLSYAFCGLAGIVAYMAMMGMRYTGVPVGYVDWIETLGAVGMISSGVAHLFYKVKKERNGG